MFLCIVPFIAPLPLHPWKILLLASSLIPENVAYMIATKLRA